MAAEDRSSIRSGTSSGPGPAAASASQADSQPQPQASPPAAPPRGRRQQACRFFGSASGCRAGAQCPFAHEQRPRTGQAGAKGRNARQRPPGSRQEEAGGVVAADPERREPSAAAPSPVPDTTPTQAARVVPRPTPRAQQDDPREFQLAQIRRRFSPAESLDETTGAAVLAFAMKPSDPDFPYEIDALKCVLRVPAAFPHGARPALRVTNEEMERGFQANCEKGFDALVARNPTQTLLGLMNALDRQLEALLSAEKAETFSIKIVPNAARAVPKHGAAAVPTPPPPVAMHSVPQIPQLPAQPQERAPPAQPAHTNEQKSQAKARRDQETRQLKARLGRLPQFSTIADGVFVVPVDPRRRSDLPVALQAIKTVKLHVPELYPLQPCRVEPMGIEKQDALPLEQAFEQRAKQFAQMSLINHINYFSQNMHAMAQASSRGSEQKPTPLQERTVESHMSNLTVQAGQGEAASASAAEASVPSKFGVADDKSHIITIPRPPEWTVHDAEDEENSYDSYTDDDSEAESEAEGGGADQQDEIAQASGPERGVAMSFPHLELYGIELLELTSLSLTVKCARCKESLDVKNVKNNANADHANARNESCKKCAHPLGIGYRMDLMHANSVRAGYLDLDGCTPADMLPSNFVPTCAGCSTQYTAPGVVSVRGESSMTICRVCHKKMTFRIAEIKFLLVSASAARATRALLRKKAKEKLGIVAGQELPKRGRCKHYSKSNRWFRFSCCNKVYPCDRCHDEEADHPNEHANRMICGFCSREQNYRPEDCGICHATLVGKKGTGFWEGGKGTRDRVRMSRKDPRKYKRRGGAGNAAVAGAAKKA